MIGVSTYGHTFDLVLGSGGVTAAPADLGSTHTWNTNYTFIETYWEVNNIHQYSKSTLCMSIFEKCYGQLVLFDCFANKWIWKFETDSQTDYSWFLGSCKCLSPKGQISNPIGITALFSPLFATAVMESLVFQALIQKNWVRGGAFLQTQAGPASARLNPWFCWMSFAEPLHQTGQIFAEAFPDGLCQHRRVKCQLVIQNGRQKGVVVVVHMQRWSVVVQCSNGLIEANVVRCSFIEIVDGMPPKVLYLHGMSR